MPVYERIIADRGYCADVSWDVLQEDVLQERDIAISIVAECQAAKSWASTNKVIGAANGFSPCSVD